MHPTDESVRIARAQSIGDDALDIALTNGTIILLKTSLILSLPGFEGLGLDDRVLYPKTDGLGLYWSGGLRLTLDQLREISFKNP